MHQPNLGKTCLNMLANLTFVKLMKVTFLDWEWTVESLNLNMIALKFATILPIKFDVSLKRAGAVQVSIIISDADLVQVQNLPQISHWRI
jgi:hypothetical protein